MRTFSSVLPFTRRFGVRGVTCMTNGAQGGEGVVSPDPSQDKDSLCVKIADTISDYRKDDGIRPRTADDVGRWAAQFDNADQLPILEEMAHILNRMYFSKAKVREFIRAVVPGPKLTGVDPAAFWRGAEILDLQLAGSRSQRDMLALFDEELRAAYGFGKDACKGGGKTFVYLDDGVFSGNTAKNDIKNWLEKDKPQSGFVLHVAVIAPYKSGVDYVKATANGKGQIKVNCLNDGLSGDFGVIPNWRKGKEGSHNHPDNVGVLWPRCLPSDSRVRADPRADPHVAKWARREEEESAEGDPSTDIARPEGKSPKFFKSEHGRHVLEQAFLRKGAYFCSQDRITERNKHTRPLGNQVWRGWGFGAMFVTYRNCPNNCPLALWWEHDDWVPLFPRRHGGTG